ncbi:MAG: glutamate ligase domain-containing protein, partial [Desulfobulbales bacterium]
TLSALHDAWPERRLVVLFQPHRYSRTKALAEEFYTAFHEADILLVTEIYPASESPIPGVTAETLLNGIKQHGHRHAYFEPNFEKLLAKAIDILVAGDIVLSLGAGNIWQTGEMLLEILQDK